ncbi:MAG: hypothetical protein HC811_07860 [Flammeovirgaceae bacterium]|nr:hypothetical protein [Flammeovirgaceae bacterium]
MVVRYFFFLFFLFPLLSLAQGNRYMVFFKDKNGTPYSVSTPGEFLSQASILRRTQQNISTTTEDLPPNPVYVSQVEGTGAKTFYTTRWMNGVLIEADAALIPVIEALPVVDRVDLVAPGKKLAGGRTGTTKGITSSTAEASDSQLQMIGIDEMHTMGYRGEGIDIAVFDSGFIGVNTASPFADVFTTNRVISQKDFVGNTSNIFSTTITVHPCFQ